MIHFAAYPNENFKFSRSSAAEAAELTVCVLSTQRQLLLHDLSSLRHPNVHMYPHKLKCLVNGVLDRSPWRSSENSFVEYIIDTPPNVSVSTHTNFVKRYQVERIEQLVTLEKEGPEFDRDFLFFVIY